MALATYRFMLRVQPGPQKTWFWKKYFFRIYFGNTEIRKNSKNY